ARLVGGPAAWYTAPSAQGTTGPLPLRPAGAVPAAKALVRKPPRRAGRAARLTGGRAAHDPRLLLSRRRGAAAVPAGASRRRGGGLVRGAPGAVFPLPAAAGGPAAARPAARGRPCPAGRRCQLPQWAPGNPDRGPGGAAAAGEPAAAP